MHCMVLMLCNVGMHCSNVLMHSLNVCSVTSIKCFALYVYVSALTRGTMHCSDVLMHCMVGMHCMRIYGM